MSMNAICPNGYTDYLSRRENRNIKNLSLDISYFNFWCDLPAENYLYGRREWHIQKSFYGKAKVYADCITGWFIMTSYNTPICAINRKTGEFVRFWYDWSSTTAKHIKAFIWYMVYDIIPDTEAQAARELNREFGGLSKKQWLNIGIMDLNEFIGRIGDEHNYYEDNCYE